MRCHTKSLSNMINLIQQMKTCNLRKIILRPIVQVRYGATIDQQAGSLEYSVALAAADAQAKESPIQLPAMFKLMQRASIKASLHIPRAWSAVVAKMVGDPRVSAESLEQMVDGFAA